MFPFWHNGYQRSYQTPLFQELMKALRPPSDDWVYKHLLFIIGKRQGKVNFIVCLPRAHQTGEAVFNSSAFFLAAALKFVFRMWRQALSCHTKIRSLLNNGYFVKRSAGVRSFPRIKADETAGETKGTVETVRVGKTLVSMKKPR